MLANVLKSTVAVRASIQVVRAFVNLRRMVAAHEDLTRSIERLERRVDRHDTDLQGVLTVLRKLVDPAPLPPKRRIGFLLAGKSSRTA
jgi:Skp family chaperone for outer membrane proteins